MSLTQIGEHIEAGSNMTRLGDDHRVVFYGDSITAADRDADQPSDLGAGYVRAIYDLTRARGAATRLTIFNRGKSGDRTVDLIRRFDQDVGSLAPTILSILVGINDTWRRYDSGDETTAAEYESHYRCLLNLAGELTGLRIVMIEPFLLPLDAAQAEWREDLDPKIAVMRALATEYGACLVEADTLFSKDELQNRPGFWAHDGVHLTTAGHQKLARAWLAGCTAAGLLSRP